MSKNCYIGHKLAHSLMGVTFREAKSTMDQIGYVDAMLLCGYIHASALAVNIRGDRHEWNLKKAHEWAVREIDQIRQRYGLTDYPVWQCRIDI